MTTGRDITWRRTILSAGALVALAIVLTLAWRLALLVARAEAGWASGAGRATWHAWREYYVWIMLAGGIAFVAWAALSNRPLGRRRMIALLVSLPLACATAALLGAGAMLVEHGGGSPLCPSFVGHSIWYSLPLLFLASAGVSGLRPGTARLALAMLIWLQGPLWAHVIGLFLGAGHGLLNLIWDGFYTPLPVLSFGLLFLPWPTRGDPSPGPSARPLPEGEV